MSKGTLVTASVVVLLFVNLIPLWGVIFKGWDVANILHLYWAENVAVGLVTVLKILTNRSAKVPLSGLIFMAGFFTVHYGFFCYGHASFVFGGLPLGGNHSSRDALGYLQAHPLLFCGFLASHLVSFFFNYHGKGESKSLEPGKVMFQPYRRIAILHITIILGGIAVSALGSPTALIVALVVIKIVADLILHRKEHRASSIKKASPSQ